MESVHVTFDDKKIQGLEDEGYYDALQFENESHGELLVNSDDDLIKTTNVGGNELSVDNNPSMANRSTIDTLNSVSADNPSSTNNPSTAN